MSLQLGCSYYDDDDDEDYFYIATYQRLERHSSAEELRVRETNFKRDIKLTRPVFK